MVDLEQELTLVMFTPNTAECDKIIPQVVELFTKSSLRLIAGRHLNVKPKRSNDILRRRLQIQIIVFVFEGLDAVNVARKLIDNIPLNKSEKFARAADSLEEAKREIKKWFTVEDILRFE